MSNKLQTLIDDLKDVGVSGEFDEMPVTRAELAEALEAIQESLANLEDKILK